MASRVPIARRKGRYRGEETYLRFGYRDRSLRTSIRRNDRLLRKQLVFTQMKLLTVDRICLPF